MKVSGKQIRRILIAAIALTSLLANVALAIVAENFYSKYKLSAVFPYNSARFQGRGIANDDRTGRQVIVLFGDSRIREWTSFAPNDAAYLSLNRGVGGETTAQLKLRIEEDVIAHSPDIVVIQAGINDLTTIGLAPEKSEEIKLQLEQNMQEMINILLDNDAKVILTTIIPPAEPSLVRRIIWDSSIDDAVTEINQRLRESYSSEDVLVVDIYKALQNENGEWKEGVNRDTLHMTERGYEEMNVLLKESLKSFQ
jgi:lysophospholipase L1-like esterase